MKNALAVIGRYGPLVSAVLVGLGGLLAQIAPQAKPLVDSVVTLFGFFGVQADGDIVGAVAGVVSSVLLVYGGSRKTINIVKDKLAPKE